MSERLIRISLEVAILVYMIIMYCLWKDTGVAKTSETDDEAKRDIIARRRRNSLRRRRKPPTSP